MSYEKRGDALFLSGAIDETAQLGKLLEHEVDGRLVLDLGGVTFINSLGVRDWIRMQQAAATARIGIELRRVAEPIVHQLNIVPAARGTSIVTSFYAPYECEECDREHLMLLDVRTHGADLAKRIPPKLGCPDCKRPLGFADPPDLYFMFLTS